MKYNCSCGQIIADIKRSDLFSTFGRRTWVECGVLKVKCRKCGEVTEIQLKRNIAENTTIESTLKKAN